MCEQTFIKQLVGPGEIKVNQTHSCQTMVAGVGTGDDIKNI